jgi:hypothetical protein
MTENEKLRELLKDARDTLFCCRGLTNLLDRIDEALAQPSEQEETEHAMHLRIRAGYDKTIADSWRAKVAEIEKERDQARAEIEFLRGVGCNELDGTDVRGPCGACLKCARRERDEARALRAVDVEKSKREVLLIKQRVADLKFALGTDAAGWFDRFKAAQQERDEARARCEKLRELADMAAAEQGLAQRRMLEAQQERDEARAMVGLLKDTNESDLRMLRATEAALDLTAVENEDLKRKAAAAYKRGAEAMQEAAAKACEAASWKRPDECADDIRDLKIPEDK